MTEPVVGYARRTPIASVHYRLRRADLFWMQARAARRSPALVGTFLLLAAAWLVWGFKQPAVASRSLEFKIVFAIVFAGLFLASVGVLMTVTLLLTVLLQRNRGVLGEHTLEVTDEGLVERTEFNEGFHRWAGIHRVVAHPRFLLVHITDTQAHIVPWRFFAAPYEAANFQREIEERVRRAQQAA